MAEHGVPRGELPIVCIGDHRTMAFAAEELARYLERMTGLCCPVRSAEIYAPAEGVLWLGEFAEFRLCADEYPRVDDPRWDDAFAIRVDGGMGIIAGSNPRSVLFGVYRLLEALGCRWLRPGPDGEIVPEIDPGMLQIRLARAADARYRGVDLAGAISIFHALDAIDWLAKLGFNAYFLEFDDCHVQCGLWYMHTGHPDKAAEDFTPARAEAFRVEMIDVVRKRGCLYHAKGHGWTTECLGIRPHGWDAWTTPAPPETVPFLAEVNGERQLFHNRPLRTNLCYSNPEARRRFVECVAEYAAAHPEIDLLHVWLSDYYNNFCECPACRNLPPTDAYVLLLNALDVELTRRDLPVRIVFLLYYELLWPPVKERLQNPDRFTLMFAPISRTYAASFADVRPETLPALPPYELNRFSHPKRVEDNLAFLAHWQRQFAGDSFLFDYHYWMYHYHDPGGMHMARVAHRDIQALAVLGLHGYVGCQTLRQAYPTGFGQYVLGRTLWELDSDFADLQEEYFAAAFGADGHAVADYLDRISGLFPPAYMLRELPAEDAASAALLTQVAGVIDDFQPVIAAHLDNAQAARAASWRLLAVHAAITRELGLALAARAQGDHTTQHTHGQQALRLIWDAEEEFHPVLDAYLFSSAMGGFAGEG